MYLASGVLAETDGSGRTLCQSSLEFPSEGECPARWRCFAGPLSKPCEGKVLPGGGASLGVRSLSE
eukprot:2042859-Heterocapsa_arctica.AAC.1